MRIQTNITVNYVPSWGIQEAIRELTQNALDCNSMAISYCEDSWQLRIDTDSVLGLESLYLGESSKRDDSSMIGKHGEGLKLAMLVLAREDRLAVITSAGVDIVPELVPNELADCSVLEFSIDPLLDGSNGTTVLVGVSPREYEQFQDTNKLKAPFGILGPRAQGDKGKLYISGLYVCDTLYSYSYNFAPGTVSLERDRTVANPIALEDAITELWLSDEENLPRILQGLKDDAPDFAGLANYSTVLPRWLATALDAMFEGEQLVTYGEKLTGAIGTVSSRVLHTLYTRSSAYRKPVYKQKPHEFLAEFLVKNKSAIHYKQRHKFDKLVAESKKWFTIHSTKGN